MIRQKTASLPKALLCATSALVLSATANVALAQSTEQSSFDIPEQNLSAALIEFSRQSNVTVIAPTSMTTGHKSAPVNGEFAPQEALELLLSNASLNLRTRDDGVIILSQADATDREAARALFRLAQLDQEEDVRGVGPRDEEDEETRLDEIVVTGTNIRGADSAGSPVFSYDREDFDSAGFSTVQQFIQTLPQNFNEGNDQSVSFGASGGPRTQNSDVSGATGLNLRGLSNNSTLVLLDGRRLPPSGNAGRFVDVSMIPLSAVERIEVLTDGASAIYGSDAIGGVVNIILRDDFDGGETNLRFGSAIGGAEEFKASQAVGTTWNSGSAFINYEYYRREKLDGTDRDYLDDVIKQFSVLPEQERHSIIVSGNQSFGDDFIVTGNFIYSVRDLEEDILPSTVTRLQSQSFGENEQIGGTIGFRKGLFSDWEASVDATYGTTSFNRRRVREGTEDFNTESDYSLWHLNGKIDGTLFSFNGGEVKSAIGVGFRQETAETSSFDKVERDVAAIYGELRVPLISQQNGVPLVNSLALSLAGRYEEYSDFGNSFDPKIGVGWVIVEGLRARASYGTSFRAPSFVELDETTGSAVLLFPIPDAASATGSTPTILLGGNNANLDPETSTTFTAGIDWNPTSIEGLSIELTYYDIEFDDRIASGAAGRSPFALLNAEDVLGPDIIIRNPSLSVVQEWAASPLFANPFGIPLSDVGAIADARLANLGSTKTSGLDVTVNYSNDLSWGTLGFSLNANYILDFINQTTSAAPESDIVNTIYNPAEFRLRGGASMSRGALSANMFINYVGGYENPASTLFPAVDSWATVDAVLRYNLGQRFDQGSFKGVSLSLSAINLFNEDPPFVESALPSGISFDSTNANALGRFVSFEITKAW